jgi:hypothetical protein
MNRYECVRSFDGGSDEKSSLMAIDYTVSFLGSLPWDVLLQSDYDKTAYRDWWAVYNGMAV